MSLVFAHPAIAAATVGLAAIPFVIHWLSRRRFRQEPWAAMAFLLSAQRRSRRRMTFEHWVLMVLRTLVILAVGLAIARPALSDSALARTAAARFDRLILLDDTLSMQARGENGRSTFDSARDLALRLIDDFSPRDGVAVVTLSGRGKALVDRPTIDRALVKRLVAQLTCSNATGRPMEAFAIAREVLRRGDAPRDCQAVYVLTDGQSATWREKAENRIQKTESRNSKTSSDDGSLFSDLCNPEFRFVFDLAPQRRSNAAVVALRPTTRWVSAGLPATFVADVAAHGLTLTADVAMEWSVDGRQVATVPLGPPGTSGLRRSELQHRFNQPGTHVIRAKLAHAGDALAIDDERFLAVEAATEVPVLIVSGESSGGPAGDPGFYLSLALSPAGQGERLFVTRSISEAELRGVALDDVRAVVLADVRQLSATDWSRLARYVRGGGGLFVSLGEHVDAVSYNASAGPRPGPAATNGDARDLLPLALDHASIENLEAAGILLRVEDWTHPLLADLSEHTGGGLLTTPFHGYIRAARIDSARTAGARTILSFSNGEPALVEHSFGRGRVLLWNSSMQMDWSALPAKPDFVPLLMNLIGYLAGGEAQFRNVHVGESMWLPLPREQAASEIVMRRPDGRQERMRIVDAGGSDAGRPAAVGRYERTDAPGAYTAQMGNRRESLVVNTDPVESDLLPLGENGFKLALGGSVHYANDAGELSRNLVATPRREMSGMLIGLLLAFVLTETLLAAWFGKDR